jgi:hypothetical protein
VKRKTSLALLIPLSQIIALCLALAFWMLWQGNPLPVWMYIISEIVLSALIFLAIGGKSHFRLHIGLERSSIRDLFIILLSYLTTGLIGVVVSNLITSYGKGNFSAPIFLNMPFLICILLPFILFDFILLGSIWMIGVIQQIENAVTHFFEKMAGKTGFFSNVPVFYASHPLVVSLFATVVFFAVFFMTFRFGYAVNDDIAMISIASGYLGGTASPVLFFSNVLLGFFLCTLYGIQSRLNWEILLFVIVNFMSVWSLVYLVFSRKSRLGIKLLGVLIILSCDAYFLISITFTAIAAFASLAGICLVLMGTLNASPVRKLSIIFGCIFILVSSLIRIESPLLVVLIVLPAAIIYHRSFHLRALLLALIVTGSLVTGCYAFNKAYLQSSPDWRTYSQFDNLLSELVDTPRLGNLVATYRDVGWSENDLNLFSHWFFPDRDTFSVNKLQYLVDHTPFVHTGYSDVFRFILDRFLNLISLPYLFFILSIWLAILIYTKPIKGAMLPSGMIVLAGLVISTFLAATSKIPNRIWVPTLVVEVVLGYFLLALFSPDQRKNISLGYGQDQDRITFIGRVSLLLAAVIAAGLLFGQTMILSRTNTLRQAAYRQILSDFTMLQKNGVISPNALIVSPSYGIPLEWANPFLLDFPRFQYLDMGWLTFTPPYEEVLRNYQVKALPDGFYRNDSVYLLTVPKMSEKIGRFITEHTGIHVDAHELYHMPSNLAGTPYEKVRLYKLELK